MPTIRPRHQVTETPEIARALDLAAARWPDESRSRLLLRLVEAGSGLLTAAEDHRRAAVVASSGRYLGAFDADYLADLRDDWPA